MDLGPQVAEDLMVRFSPAFTQPTVRRMLAVTLATIITIGHRTLTAILMVASGLLTGHFSTYYRLFSRPAWSTWYVGRILANIVIELAPPRMNRSDLSSMTRPPNIRLQRLGQGQASRCSP